MKTVKVRMLESVTGEGDEFNGIEGSFSLAIGEEAILPAALAEKWAEIGRCTVIGPGETIPEPEAVTLPPASKSRKTA